MGRARMYLQGRRGALQAILERVNLHTRGGNRVYNTETSFPPVPPPYPGGAPPRACVRPRVRDVRCVSPARGCVCVVRARVVRVRVTGGSDPYARVYITTGVCVFPSPK